MNTSNNMPKHFIFAKFWLIEAKVQDAVRKVQLMATFVERFKAITLGRSY